jgi:hypothetical protein
MEISHRPSTICPVHQKKLGNNRTHQYTTQERLELDPGEVGDAHIKLHPG